MAHVVVSKTSPKTVLSDYRDLMHQANYEKFLGKDKETVIKLNLSWSLYFPACSTEPWQLEGVLRTMRSDGYKPIIGCENRTVVTDVWKGARGNKWLPILKEYRVPYRPLTEEKWVHYRPKAEMLALDKVFAAHGSSRRESTHRIPKMFIGKNVVHLPTIKTHGHTKITGAMKNAFGGLITARRHHCHKMIHEVLVDLLAIQKEIHPGIFAVMDGTVAGDGAGPRTMKPKIKNTILASADQVAIDAVSARMMGFDPMKIPFIKIAHDKGLGCGDIDQIDIDGADIKRINWNFSTGKSPVVFWDQMLRRRLKFVEPLLFHTPLFKMCVLASGTYHDRIWYPTIGRSRINRFNKTSWGRLWSRY